MAITLDSFPERELNEWVEIWGKNTDTDIEQIIERLEKRIETIQKGALGIIKASVLEIEDVAEELKDELIENYIQYKLYSADQYDEIAKDKKELFFTILSQEKERQLEIQRQKESKGEDDVKSKGLFVFSS